VDLENSMENSMLCFRKTIIKGTSTLISFVRIDYYICKYPILLQKISWTIKSKYYVSLETMNLIVSPSVYICLESDKNRTRSFEALAKMR